MDLSDTEGRTGSNDSLAGERAERATIGIKSADDTPERSHNLDELAGSKHHTKMRASTKDKAWLGSQSLPSYTEEMKQAKIESSNSLDDKGEKHGIKCNIVTLQKQYQKYREAYQMKQSKTRSKLHGSFGRDEKKYTSQDSGNKQKSKDPLYLDVTQAEEQFVVPARSIESRLSDENPLVKVDHPIKSDPIPEIRSVHRFRELRQIRIKNMIQQKKIKSHESKMSPHMAQNDYKVRQSPTIRDHTAEEVKEMRRKILSKETSEHEIGWLKTELLSFSVDDLRRLLHPALPKSEKFQDRQSFKGFKNESLEDNPSFLSSWNEKSNFEPKVAIEFPFIKNEERRILFPEYLSNDSEDNNSLLEHRSSMHKSAGGCFSRMCLDQIFGMDAVNELRPIAHQLSAHDTPSDASFTELSALEASYVEDGKTWDTSVTINNSYIPKPKRRLGKDILDFLDKLPTRTFSSVSTCSSHESY